MNVHTNIAREFLNLVSKHFPKNHRYRKIFNKNNMKVSYSCTDGIWFSDRQERWSGSDRLGYLINVTADQPLSENSLARGGVSGDRFLITVLVDQKIKMPAWYCLGDEAVMLFDSYVRFKSKLGWHRLFLTVESTRGIRTLAVVFVLLEEMVAWG